MQLYRVANHRARRLRRLEEIDSIRSHVFRIMDFMRRADPCVGMFGHEIIELDSLWEFLKTMLQDCDEF